MTTISQIITDAYQYNNLVALNTIPSAAEQAKALRYLNRIFRGVFSNELGESLESWYFDSIKGLQPTVRQASEIAYTNGKGYSVANVRVVAMLTAPASISLPSIPQDGSRFAIQDASQNFNANNVTINASGRLIENSPQLVLNTSGTNSEWFFRADLGNWVKVSDLVLADDFPLPAEFEEYFITMLAMRLGASEDIDLNNQLAYVLKDVTKKFKSRYRQTVEVSPELGILNLTTNRHTGYNSIRFYNG